MFVLTKQEKRVVCFVLLALVVGLGVKEYRRAHPGHTTVSGQVKHLSKASARPKLVSEVDDALSPSDSHVSK